MEPDQHPKPEIKRIGEYVLVKFGRIVSNAEINEYFAKQKLKLCIGRDLSVILNFASSIIQTIFGIAAPADYHKDSSGDRYGCIIGNSKYPYFSVVCGSKLAEVWFLGKQQ